MGGKSWRWEGKSWRERWYVVRRKSWRFCVDAGETVCCEDEERFRVICRVRKRSQRLVCCMLLSLEGEGVELCMVKSRRRRHAVR